MTLSDGAARSRTVQLMSPDPTNVNLAVRHRPRSFASVVGQRHVITLLRRAVIDGVVPQQLLFSGGSGLGKTTIARILAASLLCTTKMMERENGEACGDCASCVAINEERHPDLIEFDAASNGSKDEIREIAARAQLTPLISGRRIYIIDEAHGLSQPGGQAFLKLLEEPPAHVIFMLCTTDPQKMLKTNRGRCTEFELLAPTRQDLISNLETICGTEGWSCPLAVLEMVVDATDPDLGVRGTVNTLSKLTALLSDSNALSVSAAASLLGRASIEDAHDLLVALSTGDGKQAWTILVRLRSVSSDEAIRAALLDVTRTRLIKELDTGTLSPFTVQVYEKMVTMPKGRNWLDLFVLAEAGANVDPRTGTLQQPTPTTSGSGREPNKVSASQASATPDVTTTPSSENTSVVRSGTAPVSNAPGIPDQTKSVATNIAERTISAQDKGSAESGALSGRNDNSGRTTSRRKNTKAGEGRSRSRSGPHVEETAISDTRDSTAANARTSNSDDVAPGRPEAQQSPMTPDAAFVSAVAKLDPDLAGALRRCQIAVTDSVRVTCSPPLKEDLDRGIKTLRLVAGRAGLPFELLS